MDGGRAQVPSKSRIWKRSGRGLFPHASRREAAADTLVVIQWHRHQTADLGNCRITCSCCFNPLVCVIYYSNNRKVTRKWTQFERVGSWWTCPSPPSGAKIGCHSMRAWIVNYLVLLEEVKGGCQLCSLSGQIIRILWEDGGEKSLTHLWLFHPQSNHPKTIWRVWQSTSWIKIQKMPLSTLYLWAYRHFKVCSKGGTHFIEIPDTAAEVC